MGEKKRKAEAKDNRTVANAINAILNQYDGEEALRRIREVLYGPAPVEKPDE